MTWSASLIDVLIVDGKILEAVMAIRESPGVHCLEDALVAFDARYASLRSESPERFTQSNREYWMNFHTTGPQPPMAEPGTLPDEMDL